MRSRHWLTLWFAAAGFAVVASVTSPAAAQPATGFEAAIALESVLVDLIAQQEHSVVAIARVRREEANRFPEPRRHDPFSLPRPSDSDPEPRDPDFIPHEFATGVVVDAQGLILTCHHVLKEDSDYYVTTFDRKRYKAVVKAADPRSDLAVLQIEASGLKPVTLGNGEKVRKGQIVIALGNPYAIARDGQPSASWGIVSNLSRQAAPLKSVPTYDSKPTLHHFGTLIHTDAKLNLGTSGGLLLDLHGRMIGLVTAQAALVGYEKSAGYAIPVDDAFRRILETLKAGREVEYGFLGITPSNLSIHERNRGLHGARIERVSRGTPAAGPLRPGDVVTHIDGEPIHDRSGLILTVGRRDVGDVVRLTVQREGGVRSVPVKLTKYPVRGNKIHEVPTPRWRGVTVEYKTAAVDVHVPGVFGLDFPGDDCVVVTDVEKDSPGWKSGLRPGMLISHVGSTPVETPEEFHDAVAGRSGPLQLRLVTSVDNPSQLLVPAQ